MKIVRDVDRFGERTAYIASGERPGRITWDSVALRYSYARFFERDATIQMPLVMSLAC